ncbi:MAG: PEP-CTERM sorting domain-containing protein [Verrucomicrobia bacterium]|nr:PEP-CTERM sorting domain-containing protein [Verrucomicrobiota bacterium]
MTTPKFLALALGSALACAGLAPAQTFSQTFSFSPNAAVPDGDLNGLALSQNVSTVITSILSVEVHLTLSGGFNGDLYAYLVHDTPGGTGFSILLNRVGRTTGSPFGYGDAGMTVTFSDLAATDIHSYQTLVDPGGSALSASTWQPDARDVNPLTAVQTDPRTAFLASFNGLDANGTWTLYLADVAPLGQSTVVSWGFTLHAIPEPSTVAAGLLAAGCAAAAWRRRESSRSKIQDSNRFKEQV